MLCLPQFSASYTLYFVFSDSTNTPKGAPVTAKTPERTMYLQKPCRHCHPEHRSS